MVMTDRARGSPPVDSALQPHTTPERQEWGRLGKPACRGTSAVLDFHLRETGDGRQAESIFIKKSSSRTIAMRF
jgi:hypothetical protein